MLEIERKFLVKSECYKEQISDKYKIVQGYISVATDRSVQLRLCKDRGFLTFKGANSLTMDAADLSGKKKSHLKKPGH